MVIDHLFLYKSFPYVAPGMLMGNRMDRVKTLCEGNTKNVRGEVMSSNLLSELMSKKVELSSMSNRCPNID